MDDPANRAAPIAPSWSERRLDLLCLGLLLALALGLRLWVVANTAVPARDSIGFIRYALQLEDWKYQDVLLCNHQHPGYPALVMVVSWPLRHWYGQDCETMQLAAQLASALAGWLLVVPMFYLGKLFFDRQTAFWGVLLFQCLPDSGHGLSDAISDPLYLLLLVSALLFAAIGLNRRSTGAFVLAGVFTGLGYLVRPEAALLLLATLPVLLLLQGLSAWRTSWPRFALRGLALVLPAVLVGSPYWTVAGFTNKPSASMMLGKDRTPDPERVEAPQFQSGPPLAVLLGVHIDLDGTFSKRAGRAVYGLAGELIHAFQYIAWLPALLGLIVYRQRWRQPGAWMIGLLLGGLTLLLIWLATSVGYVSNRHLMLLVLCLIFPAVALVRDLPPAVLGWLQRNWLRGTPEMSPWLGASLWSLVLLLSLTGFGLAKTLQPLHSHRAGHHGAGLWLAQHAAPWDIIADDHAWAHYYAGHVFHEGKNPTPPAGVEPVRWIVYSRASERRPPSHRRAFTEKDIRAKGGQVVFAWPFSSPEDNARVLVFRLPDGVRLLP